MLPEKHALSLTKKKRKNERKSVLEVRKCHVSAVRLFLKLKLRVKTSLISFLLLLIAYISFHLNNLFSSPSYYMYGELW